MEYDPKRKQDLIEWYFVGFALSDGHWKHKNVIQFGNAPKDIPIFDFLKEHLEIRQYFVKEYQGHDRVHVLVTITPSIREKMHKIGFSTPNKVANTYNLDELDSEELGAFMLGFVDGDGSLGGDLHTIEIDGLTLQLFEEMRRALSKYLESNIHIFSTDKHKKLNPNYQTLHRIKFSKNATREFYDIVPKFLLFDYYKHNILTEVHKTPKTKYHQRMNLDGLKRIVELRNKGYSLRKIEEETGYTGKTITKWLKKASETDQLEKLFE